MDGDERSRTFSTSCELYIPSLHSEEIVALFPFRTLLDHTIPMCQFPAEDVTEDLSISMRMCWESGGGCNAVFVEYTQAAEVLEALVGVLCEGECVVGVEEVGIDCVPALFRGTYGDLRVGESFRHCGFEGVCAAHGR